MDSFTWFLNLAVQFVSCKNWVWFGLYVGLEPIIVLAELSVVHQSFPMWRIFFFLSRLPTASDNSIALLRYSPSMDLWTWTLHAVHSPTRSALSQLNLGLLDAISILLFICVLIWLHMGSVHQDASGLKHIPLLTPCYIFMWANISNRNSHVGRHVLFSNDHPCSSSNISIAWVTSLHPPYNIPVLLHNIYDSHTGLTAAICICVVGLLSIELTVHFLLFWSSEDKWQEL